MPESILTEMVDFKSNGDQSTGYLARPTGPGSHPAVVVIQEWWGLDAHIKDLAERFARLGFASIAPDLYHGQVTSEPDEARKLAMSMQRDVAAREIDAAAAWLTQQSFAAGPRFGTVGYCMGGGLSLAAASGNSNVAACVVYYGGTPNPPESAESIQCPVLGFFGKDEAERAGQLQEILNQYNKANEVHVYDGASHGFFNDTSAGYDKAASYDSWPRVIEFFRRTLS